MGIRDKSTDMRDRIRELAEHCDFYVGNEHYDKSHEERQRLWVEKLSDLIIEDCINIIDGAVYHREPASTYADKIKDHFQ